MGNIGEDFASAGVKPTVFGTIIWMLFTRTGLIFTHGQNNTLVCHSKILELSNDWGITCAIVGCRL